MDAVYTVIFLAASATSAAMATACFRRSGGNAARITLGFAFLPIFLFTFFTAVLYLQDHDWTASLPFKLATTGVFSYGPLILNLFLRLRGRVQKSWAFLIHLSISLLLTVWVVFSDDFIRSVEYRSGMWFPVYWYSKPWMYLALGRFFFYTVSCMAQMLLWGMESKKKKVKFQSVLLCVLCFLGDSLGIASILFFPFLSFFYQFPFLLSLAWAVLHGDFLELNYRVNAEAIIENIGDAVFVLTPDLFIHRMNAAAKRIFPNNAKFFPSLMTDPARLSSEIEELEAKRKDSACLAIGLQDDRNGTAKLWLSAIRDNYGDAAGFLAICREDLGTAQFRARYGITVKEMEVIKLALEGMSNRRIAERLSLSVRTVETHMFNAYGKLNVKNRIELLSVAARYDMYPN